MKKAIIVLLALFMLFPCFGQDESEGWDREKWYAVTMGLFSDLMPSYEAIVSSPEFKAAFPKVRIDFEESDWDGHHSRLITEITRGKKANDIEIIDEGYLGTFNTGGGFADLSLIGAKGDSKDLAQFAVNKAVTSGGGIIALPMDIAPVVLYYRKDLADAAGADFDNLENWGDWLEAARKVSVDTDGDGKIDQFALANVTEMAVIALNNGIGEWYSEEGKLLEPKEKFMDILHVVKAIADENLHGNFAEWSDPWIWSYSEESKGASVCAFNGAWFEGSLKGWMAPEMAGNYRVARLPGGAAANIGGSYLGIPETTTGEMRALAYDIIKFFTTNQSAQIINLEKIGAVPALTSVYDAPEMHKSIDYFGGQKAWEIYADVALQVPETAPTEFDQLARGAWRSVVTRIIEEGISAEHAYWTAFENMENNISD